MSRNYNVPPPLYSNYYILIADILVGASWECRKDYLTFLLLQSVSHQCTNSRITKDHQFVRLVLLPLLPYKSLRNCFFGIVGGGGVFALINVKVMHFIRFVRVKLFTKGINYICFAGRCPERCDLRLSWKCNWLWPCPTSLLVVCAFFCSLIDVHNVISSHQRVRWMMAGHLLAQPAAEYEAGDSGKQER